MGEPPFDIISCSWPRPVEQAEERWVSEPEWDAPLMPARPQPRWEKISGEQCWVINWREVFAGGLKFWSPHVSGEMRGFHVVFRLRINATGKLIIWDDDGSIIRRNNEVIHSDRSSHRAARSEIAVSAGDHLEVAQWQYNGEWTWGARVLPSDDLSNTSVDLLLRYLSRVERRLRNPNGPPLKMYFSGQNPLRTVVAIYSMILNGYSPSAIIVFGEYQWSDQARSFFKALLPFTRIVPTSEALERIESLGGPQLVDLAQCHWFVMKTCIGLLCPPKEYCFMDDDVFILDRMDEALGAFEKCNLVFAPDADYGPAYLSAWGWLYGKSEPLPTASINTGIYSLRNTHDPQKIASDLMKVPINSLPGWMWEQGFMACRYGAESVFKLSAQRYFYPYCDGMPGGMLNYDYAKNPCGFVSIHFGGLVEKPTDAAALALAPEILGRSH
jgi:hypothetical protein